MTKISNLYSLTNYITANSSGNVVIAAPASGYALDVTGTGRFTGQLTLGSTITNGTYTYTLPSATGTLALTSALGSYVPYTGATGAVNLGAYDLTVNGIKVGKGGGAVYDNTVLGDSALTSNTSGSSNVAIGYSSLGANTIAGGNTAVGTYALSANISGGTNTAIGYSAGSSITTGSNNVIIGGYGGTSAMTNNVVLSDGGGNIRFQYNGTNTLIGQSGSIIVNGSTVTDGHLVNIIGNQATSGNIGIVLNNTNSTYARIYAFTNVNGNLAIYDYTSNSQRLTINSSGKVSIGTIATHGNVTVQQTTGEAGITINSSIAESPKLYLRDAGGAGYSEIQANNKLYLNSSNVGIGTTSPTTRLQVNAASATTSSTVLTIYGSESGFNSTNDANTGYSINFDGCAFSAASSIVQRTGAQIEMLKSGSWNQADTGGGTPGNLVFKTNSGTIASPNLAERMRITSGGFVGIGTTPTNWITSGYALQIGAQGALSAIAYSSTNNQVTLANNAYVKQDTSFVYIASNPAGLFRIVNSGECQWLQAGSGSAGANISFNTNMRLMDTGNLLINYSSDTGQKLQVNGNLKINDTLSSGGNLIETAGLNVYIRPSTGYRAYIDSGDGLSVSGNSTSNIQDLNINDTGSRIVLNVIGGRYAGINDTTSKMILFSSGNGTELGYIIRNGGATVSYVSSSDRRLKEDIKEFDAMDLVNRINVYDFKWKDSDSRGYGVIADELQQIIPSVVSGEIDGMNDNGMISPQGVDYGKLTPILLKAIQELSAKVTALENK